MSSLADLPEIVGFFSYSREERELAERLRAIGVEENERNLANKISRGGFTAAFFFQCMQVIGTRTIRLDTDR